MTKVLVVDDDSGVRFTLKGLLEDEGTYVMAATPCGAACTGNSGAICAADCSEIPFRAFAETGLVDEGSGLYSASLGRVELSWCLTDVRCTASKFVLTDPMLGERTVSSRTDGKKLVTGSGIQWGTPSPELVDLIQSAVLAAR